MVSRIALQLIQIFMLRGFQIDCPCGVLERATLEGMYGSFLQEQNSKIFVDQMFRVFDKDGDGSIDFKVSDDLFNITDRLKKLLIVFFILI